MIITEYFVYYSNHDIKTIWIEAYVIFKRETHLLCHPYHNHHLLSTCFHLCSFPSQPHQNPIKNGRKLEFGLYNNAKALPITIRNFIISLKQTWSKFTFWFWMKAERNHTSVCSRSRFKYVDCFFRSSIERVWSSVANDRCERNSAL